jgi:outer membrane lipoprotein-sorting protein
LKITTFVALAMFVLFSAPAQAGTPCEEVKSEIAQKLDAKGVKSYTLEVVSKDQETDGKVVGTCEGGAKKIVYRRGTSPAQAPAAADNSKP